MSRTEISSSLKSEIFLFLKFVKEYDPKEIESRIQARWAEQNLYKTIEDPAKEKCYVLNEFPYPSGEGLHVGHLKGHIATDIYSRYMRMRGKCVLHPMGWDAFGLPAENFAIKHKIHPREAVDKNIARFKEQLQLVGPDYDWSREIDTTDPKYYKWTQWIFLQLFKKGLAYESHEPINWCPSCQTGLANEDLDKGKCERCGSQVEKRRLRQWVLSITKYADRLVDDLSLLTDWPEHMKEMQREWIGRSDGLIFKARVKDSNFELKTYSAHFEACFADTFVVVAPDHPILDELIAGVENEKEIRSLIEEMNIKRLEKDYDSSELEGVFSGRYLDDPLGNGHLPIWVASYALSDYGTGIVRCSAHDPRDFAFAQKYGIPLKVVLVPEDKELRTKVEQLEVCYSDMTNGILLEPLNLSGKKGGELRDLIAEYLIENKWAEKATMYKLRDWVFSRQRYWGEPIPLIHCEKCGVVPVPEKDLPVVLPNVKNYQPTGTGESPLADISEWVNVKCPKCGGDAKRETNTMPQWAGSSWYWHRFKDAQNDNEIVSKKAEAYWNNVDVYVGGAEHVTRHLIYARFWHKFLFDIGVVTTNEPFVRRIGTGLIQASDGRKMSKRWGNVVNPDEVIAKFGADTFRIYEMFLGPFSDSVAWNDTAIIGPRRFLEKLWRLSEKMVEDEPSPLEQTISIDKSINRVGRLIEEFKFNVAIPELMTLVSALSNLGNVSRASFEKLLKIIAPFAPHIAEELWAISGNTSSIHLESWPMANIVGDLIAKPIALPIQIGGKVRTTVYVSPDITEDEIKELALANPDVRKWLGDKVPRNFIYKPGRVVSIVI